MMTMTEVRRASEGLREATEGGALDGCLTPTVFGCPYDFTARIVTSPLPFGRCSDCGTPLTVLDAGQLEQAIRRDG